jgi:HAD superfamily hydrolase (TIGR01484 family)
MKSETMRPVSQLGDSVPHIRYVLTDIDDTLTTDGRLTSEAYHALWELHAQGFSVIPVTGRPAGWCDLIIRLWPVDAVIGENGAFVYYRDGGRIKTYYHPVTAEGPPTERLQHLARQVIAEFPEARIARDQPGRQFDIAIDFCEDPPDLGLETAVHIREFCESLGAVAKISSIHVNAWFGSYDKQSMTVSFFTEVMGLSLEQLKQKAVFCGDSPNDQPMFELFPLSCAVANIRDMLDYIDVLPTFAASRRGGEGFVEIARTLIDSQR